MVQLGQGVHGFAADAAAGGRVLPRELAGWDGRGERDLRRHQLRCRAVAGEGGRGDGDKKYLVSAIRAADYIWENFGSRCIFLGATGNPAVADKESGMLSLEAFLSLYESTKELKWLERQNGGQLHGKLDLDMECTHATERQGFGAGLEARSPHRGPSGYWIGRGRHTPSCTSTRTTRTIWMSRASCCTIPRAC